MQLRPYSICPESESGFAGWIQYNRPIIARIRESSFDADSLAKQELNDVTPAPPT